MNLNVPPKPCPKPLPQEKKKKRFIPKVSKKQQSFRQKVNKAKDTVRERDGMVCQSSGERDGIIDVSHIVSERECKILGIEWLAYSPEDMVCQRRIDHLAWECMDVDKIAKFKNLDYMMGVLKKHHPERWIKLVLKFKEKGFSY